MSTELQSLIDDIARRFDAPAALEDRLQRMVVYSSHSEPIDEIRRDSILRRTTPREIMTWFRQFGIAEAVAPVRIPSHPEHGILGRLCVPVRYQARLMGFIWLIDDDERLSSEDAEIAERYGQTAGLLMYRDELSHRLAGDVFLNLLSPSQELRETSAREIVELGMFPAERSCSVIVVQPMTGDDATTDPTAAVNRALAETARDTHGDALLRLSRSDHGAILVPHSQQRDPSAPLSVAHSVRDAVARALGQGGGRSIAAVGDPQAELTRAFVSYRHARLAVRVAAVVPTLGDVPEWQKLGVFRALALLPPDEIVESVLDPRLLALFENGDADVVETLETYLDLGCDAKTTSEQLYMHRATLYYRLKKAERLTGFNLGDGNDRLTLHLGLKLSRLAQVHPDGS